jgi:hypothetical protein
VAMTVDPPLMALGQAKPSLQIEIVFDFLKVVGPSRNSAAVLSTNTETLEAGCEVLGDRRARQRRSARCEKRGVRSSQEYCVAELGTDGPARRSSLLSPAWWTGPPPIPRRGPPRATNRVTRPPRRSPPQEAARGFWIRAWGQREPALQGTGRSNDPARWPGRSRVGWTFPATHAKCNSLRIEHPIRTLTYCAMVTHRSNGDLCLACENCLLE